jgi:hypothetical protein
MMAAPTRLPGRLADQLHQAAGQQQHADHDETDAVVSATRRRLPAWSPASPRSSAPAAVAHSNNPPTSRPTSPKLIPAMVITSRVATSRLTTVPGAHTSVGHHE